MRYKVEARLRWRRHDAAAAIRDFITPLSIQWSCESNALSIERRTERLSPDIYRLFEDDEMVTAHSKS